MSNAQTVEMYIPAEFLDRIERAEKERDEARDTASKLNRRLTKAEGIIEAAQIVDNRPTKGGGGLGRVLANYAAEKYMRERHEARKALSLISEDCEAWMASEIDEPSCEFIKLVGQYAKEASK